MNAAECLKLLTPPLKFGDENQIRARETLERIYEVRDAILACREDHHRNFKHNRRSLRGSKLTKAALLEELEDEITECKCWQLPHCYADELLAAVSVLLESWWRDV